MAARRLALLAFAAGAHALAPTPNRRRPARAVAVRSSTNVDKYPAPRRGRSNNFVTSLGLERDKALQALSTLDRGEFRWEFLTPWLDRELTRLDKVIVCSAFIGVAIVGQKLLEPQTAISQHLSYIANFFSYTIGNQIGYRVIAILASLLEIFAYGVEDGGFGVREDAIPETYNVLFIVVNLRAEKESEIPNFKGSYLGRFPLVSADFWTSDHLSERSRSVGAVSETRARGKLTLKRR